MMFFAPGQPIGKGRPRFGNGRAYTPARTLNYEKYVAAIASDRMQELKQAPTTGPCSVHIVATDGNTEVMAQEKTSPGREQ
jgi:Holliday junction resolvase RusA-like endonuclease